jgi:hypothetical protein
MMRKIIFILVSGLLFLSLSESVFARGSNQSRSDEADEYQADSVMTSEADSSETERPKKRRKIAADDYSNESEYSSSSEEDARRTGRRTKGLQMAAAEDEYSYGQEDEAPRKSRRSKSRQASSGDEDYGYTQEEESVPRKSRASRGRRYASDENEDGMGYSSERPNRSRRSGGLLHEILWAGGEYESVSAEGVPSTSTITVNAGYLYHLGGGLQAGPLVDLTSMKDSSTTLLGGRLQYNLSPNIADSIFLFGQLNFGQTKSESATISLTNFGFGLGKKIPLVKHVSYSPSISYESQTVKTTSSSSNRTKLTLTFLGFSAVF